MIRKHEFSSAISALNFSQNSKSIAVGEENGAVSIIDLSSMTTIALPPQNGPIEVIVFSNDGKHLLVKTEVSTLNAGEQDITIWNESGELIQALSSGTESLGDDNYFFSLSNQCIILTHHDFEESDLKVFHLSHDEQASNALEPKSVFFGASHPNAVYVPLQLVFLYNEKKQRQWLTTNLFRAWANGTLWDHVYKLTPEEMEEYGIDWEY
ncbi:MAG: hypothetical protein AAFZ63_13335 [Bacteroidota bacterium]